MRVHIIIAILLILTAVSLLGQSVAETSPTADQVIAQMFARDTQREIAAEGYTGYRQYDLENHRFHKHARMLVSVTCDQDGTKHLQIVSEEGWRSANKRVLRRMLESEAEASRPLRRPSARITPENYTFRMIELATLEGRPTYVIDVVPKREDTLLFRGRIWVDAEDYALARVEGEPAKTLSFWINSVHFTQRNHKVGEVWFPSSTTSVSEARIFGPTEVDIHYFDYTPHSYLTAGPTRSAPSEVSNVKN